MGLIFPHAYVLPRSIIKLLKDVWLLLQISFNTNKKILKYSVGIALGDIGIGVPKVYRFQET